jgi:D-inositol-3-phosphate glycosyltransferase
VHPGVDLEHFRQGDRDQARDSLGIARDAIVLLFVGRIQPLKAPDVLLKAVAALLTAQPDLRSNLVVAVCGGPSGTGLQMPDSLIELAKQLGISDCVRFEPPLERDSLRTWFQAAHVTVVPSYSESFGLVALESQACGTPVIAANVGGLPTAVAPEAHELLVSGHNANDWASTMAKLISDPELSQKVSAAGVAHAMKFGWESTADALLKVYWEAVEEHKNRQQG